MKLWTERKKNIREAQSNLTKDSEQNGRQQVKRNLKSQGKLLQRQISAVYVNTVEKPEIMVLCENVIQNYLMLMVLYETATLLHCN